MTAKKWFWSVLFFVTGVQLVGSVAFALETLVPAPSTDALPTELFNQAYNAIVNKQYAMALGPVVASLVWLLRKYDVKIPKYGAKIDAFLNQPFVAFLLPTVVAAVGGLGTALAAGQPLPAAIGAVFQAAFGAVFTYVGIKKVIEQKQAGAAEAAKVSDKQTAIDELTKP